MAERKLTDADVMTGFNPAYQVPAEELEAQQESGEPSTETSEGEGTAPETERTSTPTVEEREVVLDGRAFKAPREIADAFTREINRRDGTRGAELQTLRERLARLEGATTKPVEGGGTQDDSPQMPDPEMAIENPAEYQRQLVAHIDYKQTLRVEALARQNEEAEAAKGQESARRDAWQKHVDSFYSQPENKLLLENKDIVDLVLEQNRDRLAPLSVEEGFKELSKLAKDRLARVTGQAPEIKGRTTPRPAVLEGGGRRGPAALPAVEKTGPASLTQALKERRRAANEAFAKGSAVPRPAPSR
jgi:hypothetical protein